MDSAEVGGEYSVFGVPVLLDGSYMTTAMVGFGSNDVLTIDVNDPNKDDFALFTSSNFSTDNGTTATLTPTSGVTGVSFLDCTARLVTPRSPFPTLAMFSAPVFAGTCAGAGTLAIAAASITATPEPPTLILLAIAAVMGLIALQFPQLLRLNPLALTGASTQAGSLPPAETAPKRSTT